MNIATLSGDIGAGQISHDIALGGIGGLLQRVGQGNGTVDTARRFGFAQGVIKINLTDKTHNNADLSSGLLPQLCQDGT